MNVLSKNGVFSGGHAGVRSSKGGPVRAREGQPQRGQVRGGGHAGLLETRNSEKDEGRRNTDMGFGGGRIC